MRNIKNLRLMIGQNQNKNIVQKIVLGGVVVRNGKILILQRHKDEDVYPNMWELPSGKREPLEPSENSLIREVKEETGLEVKTVLPFSVFDYQIEKPQEIRDSTQINFLVVPTSEEEVKISDEHQAFAWIGPEEINQYDLTDATKNVIRKAFEVMTKIL